MELARAPGARITKSLVGGKLARQIGRAIAGAVAVHLAKHSIMPSLLKCGQPQGLPERFTCSAGGLP